MKTSEEYLDSLRQRRLRLFLRGERVENPVDHPLIAPSVRTVAQTYRLAESDETRDVVVAHSRFIDGPVNRFTHIFESEADLHAKQRMQRLLGQITGTCFQRCVGMEADGSQLHERFLSFLRYVQTEDLICCGAMTDAKGDRRKPPHEQPDKYLRVVSRTDDHIVVRGAKMHQTGVVNSHEIIVMPGGSMTPADHDFAVAFAVPLDTDGITLVYGRQPSDGRRAGCALDQGNAKYGGQEAVVIFENVRVPIDRVFMDGQTGWTRELVEYFAGHHRHSYGGCKPGNIDVLIGASALAARYAGVERASHIKDKLVEMTHLNETLFACGRGCASACYDTPSGTVMVDDMLANVCKHNVTRHTYEIGRLAEDIAGGLMATMPSGEDLEHPEIGPLLRDLIVAADGSAEDRARILRLIESMTLGTTAVPLRTEAMHGAGSPQAQRLRIAQQADFEGKMKLARRIVEP
jgi:4-hydroxybutyryl-CoA dehydratase/vinylacetyl-CoA-Delta-isomerase